MEKADLTLAADVYAPILPSRKGWNEVRRRSKLDIYLKLFLYLRDRAKHFVQFRIKLQVDVDGRVTPAHENGSRAAGEIAVTLRPGSSPERAHKFQDLLFAG